VTQALAARVAHPIYGYSFFPESLYATLMDWLQQRHGWTVQREWIVMAPGVVPSLHAAVQAFTSPGQGVIVQPPVYFPFFSSVTTGARELLLNPLRLEAGRYRIDFEHLEQCAATGARLLLLCSPHNPVGRVWSAQELQEILRIARHHELVVLADEIHADLVYPEYRHTVLGALAQNGERIVTAVAPSKTFNIPGLGLSCLIVPNAADRAALVRVFASLHVQQCNPFSSAAFEAAYRGGAEWLDSLMAYLQGNRDYVGGYLQAHLRQIKLIQPEGTYLLWLDCRELNLNDQQLRDFFVRQARVGMNRGTVFGANGSGFMRLNIGAPRQVIEEALQRIAQALRGK
jgi:cystathionine beta-lyase